MKMLATNVGARVTNIAGNSRRARTAVEAGEAEAAAVELRRG